MFNMESKKQDRMCFTADLRNNWKDYIMTNETGIYYIRTTVDKNGYEKEICQEVISDIPIKLLKIRDYFKYEKSTIEVKGTEYILSARGIVILLNKLTDVLVPKKCDFSFTDIIKMTLMIQERQLERIKNDR